MREWEVDVSEPRWRGDFVPCSVEEDELRKVVEGGIVGVSVPGGRRQAIWEGLSPKKWGQESVRRRRRRAFRRKELDEALTRPG